MSIYYSGKLIAGKGKDGKDGKDGIGYAIGDVVFSYSSLYTDNPGKLPLFTGETIIGFDEIYPDFYTWLTNHTELTCTLSEYTTTLETSGECAKYGITNDGTVRLPLIKNYIKAANTTDGVENIEAGLPNITGTWEPAGLDVNNYEYPTGAFANSKRSSNGYLGHASKSGQTPFADFDASLSNPIYGNSDTVTPPSTTLYPWVVAFNAAVEPSVAQAAEYQQALSSKADANLGNIASNIDYVVERWQAEEPSVTWANVPFYNSYEIYKSGWCRQHIYGTNNASVTYLKPFSKTPHIKTELFGTAGSAYFAHSINIISGVDLKTGCVVNWSGSEYNPQGVVLIVEGYVEEQ